MPSLFLLSYLLAADNPPATSAPKFTLELVDGSSLIGTLSFTSIEMQTSLGKMTAPVQKIRSVEMDNDHETLSVLFENGDKLTGRLSIKTFKLNTVLGEINLDLTLLRRMESFSTEEQKLKEILGTPEKKRQVAQTILNECRQVDAAKDQYALENNKTGQVVPSWNDLIIYLNSQAPLSKNAGKDSLGFPFLINSISERLIVNPKSKDALKEVTGGDTFWGPYS